MSSADRVAHIDGQLEGNYCEQYTRASSGSIKSLQSNKTEQSIYECLLGFCLTHFSRRHKFYCIDSFLFCPIPFKEMMGDGFWCYRRRFVLNSKRLLSTSCNKQGQRSSERGSIFFMVLFLMFLKFAESYV